MATGNARAGGSRRVWVVVLVLTVLAVLAAGYAFHQADIERLRQAKHEELAAIGELKAGEICQWRDERLADARRLSGDALFVRAVQAWIANPDMPGLRAVLQERLDLDRETEGFSDAILADAGGRILASAKHDPDELGAEGKRVVEDALAARGAVVGDFFRCSKGVVHVDTAAPMLDAEGRVLAVLVMRSNAGDFLYPLIQSWPTPRRSAETLLVRRDGDDVLFLNELRHATNTALAMRHPLARTDLPATQAVLGRQGIFEGRDYRGVKVLADLRPIPGSPWFMVAKVDLGEFMAEARYRTAATTLLVGLLILLVAALTAFAYRQRQVLVYRALERVERERQAVARHLHDLTKYANDIIFLADTDKKIVEANDRAVQTYGYGRDELIGMPLQYLRAAEATATLNGDLKKADAQNGAVVETIHRRKDGTTFPVESSLRPIHIEDRKFYQSIVRDITERKRAAHDLEASETRYRRLFESAKDGILILDADTGRIVDVNPFLVSLTGWSREEFLARHLWEIGPFKDIVASKASFVELQAKGYVRYEDLPLETRDGRKIAVEFVSNMYRVDNQKVIQCNVRDITERRQAAEREGHLNAVLRAIRNVNQLIVREKDSSALIHQACRLLIETRGYQSAWIALLEPDGRLRDAAEAGIGKRFEALVDLMKKGRIPSCAQSPDRPGVRVIADPAGECADCPLHDLYDGRAVLIRRLDHEGRVYGLLVVSMASEMAAIPEEQNLLEEMSGDLGLALHGIETEDRRRAAEDALRKSMERYRRTLDGMLEGCQIIGPDWKYLYVNETAARHGRKTRDELVGRTMMEAYPGIEGAKLFDVLRHCMKERVPERMENEFIYADGARGYFELSIEPVPEGLFILSADVTERRKAEREIQLFRALIEQSKDTIEVVDPLTLRFLDANEAAYRGLGYRREEFLSLTVHDTDLDVGEERLKWIGEELQRSGVALFESRHRRKDGSTFPVEVALKAVHLDRDYLVAVVRDITDRKKAEAALQEAQDLLNEVGTIAKIGGWKMDLATRKATWTRGTYEIVEIEPGQPVPGPDEHVDYYLPEYRPLIAEAMRALIEEDRPLDFEAQLKTAKGNIKWCRAQGRATRRDGRAVEVYGTLHDITERKRAEEAVRGSRELLEAVLNSIPVRVFWKDRNLVYLGCNTPFARDAGFEKPEELIGKDDHAMGWRDQAELYRADDRAVIESGKAKLLFEEQQTTPSGQQIHLLTSKIPLRNAGGEIVGVLGTYYDITQLKRAEEELHQVVSSARCILWRAVVTPHPERGMIWDLRISNEEAAEKMLPHARQPGQSYSQAWHTGTLPEDLERIHRTSGNALREGKPGYAQEFRCRTANGDIRWLSEDARIQPLGPNRWLVVGVCMDVTERKRAEEALRESEARYRLLIDNAQFPVVVVSTADARVLFVNERASALFGVPAAEAVGLLAQDFWCRKKDLYRYVHLVRGQGEVRDFETMLRSKSGAKMTVTLSSNLIEFAGEPADFTVFQDITERKKAEQGLRESEEKYRVLAETTPDIIWQMDLDLRFTYVNSAIETALGYTAEEFTGRQLPEFCSEDNLRRVREIIAREMQDLERHAGVVLEMDMIHKDGRSIPLEVHGMIQKDAGGKPTGFQGVSRDITERKQADRLLQESRSRYAAVFEATGTATLLVEEDATIIMANSECLPVTGYRPEELLGTKWTRYVAPESLEVMLKYHKLRREDPGKAPRKYEVKLVNKQGAIRNAVLDVAVIPGTGRSVVSMLDITERKQAEEQMTKQMNELRRWHEVTVGREERVSELKREVNDLLARLGEKSKYGGEAGRG